MVKSILFVALGASFGGIVRYLTSLALNKTFGWGTLVVNVIGSFILGFIIVKSESGQMPDSIKLMLTTGCMGALTTFSTFSYETVIHFQNGTYKVALFNILINILLGLSAVFVGMKSASLITI